MNNYLQRLIDRAAPTLSAGAGVFPAGLSQSPISLSDQRANDPDFTERYTPGTEAREQFGELTAESPGSISRRSPQQPDADTLPSEAARIRVDSAPPQITMPMQELPTTEIASPSLQHPRPTGHVDTADLVLPESEAASSRPAMSFCQRSVFKRSVRSRTMSSSL